MLPPGYTVLEDGTILGKKGMPLKLGTDRYGYSQFSVRVNGKRKTFTAHKAVCEAFHGPKPFPEAQVRHINGVKSDNRASNLRWGTPLENTEDKRLHGVARGAAHEGAGTITPS
jgi:hypothetical protein